MHFSQLLSIRTQVFSLKTHFFLFRSAEPTTGGSDVGRIDSEVISVSIYPMNINNFEEPVTLIIKNNEVSKEFFFSASTRIADNK